MRLQPDSAVDGYVEAFQFLLAGNAEADGLLDDHRDDVAENDGEGGGCR